MEVAMQISHNKFNREDVKAIILNQAPLRWFLTPTKNGKSPCPPHRQRHDDLLRRKPWILGPLVSLSKDALGSEGLISMQQTFTGCLSLPVHFVSPEETQTRPIWALPGSCGTCMKEKQASRMHPTWAEP